MKPKQPRQPQGQKNDTTRDTSEVVPTDAAAERGERLETGKAIARGGKKTGHVPGAMTDPKRK